VEQAGKAEPFRTEGGKAALHNLINFFSQRESFAFYHPDHLLC
jgi:hypothetical protein